MGDARKEEISGLVPRRPSARLLFLFTALIAVVCAAIAAGALHNLKQSQRALDEATATISQLIGATSDAVQPNAQLESVEALLEKSRKALGSKSNDLRVAQERARIYLVLAEIGLDRGRIDRTDEDASAALAIVEPIANVGNKEARHLRAQAERLIGAVNWNRRNNDEAQKHYERGIADLNELMKLESDPKITARWMQTLAELYQGLGDVQLSRLDRPREAVDSYEKSRLLRVSLIDLGNQSPAFERDLAWVMNKRGEVEIRLGNDDAALKWFVEARDRMADLKDRIWDDPRWVKDLGAIHINIGLLKRRQNRFAEAAPQFAQAEEYLAAVYRRDPKSVERLSALNWCRFVRAENLFRFALAKNDRILMLDVREKSIAIVETASGILKQAPERKQEQLNKIREEAFRAAIDASLRQWNGNNDSAALGFIEATDIIAKDYMPVVAKMPWPDLLAENIQYLEWAGVALVRAQRASEGQAYFKRALNMLSEYRALLGDTVYEEFRQRIAARYAGSPPPVERTPPAVETAPPTIESTPPAANNAPQTENPPASTSTISPPQQ